MKKFITGSLIAALISFVLGLTLLLIGIATGGLKLIGNGIVSVIDSVGNYLDIEMSNFSIDMGDWDLDYPMYPSGEAFAAVSANEVDELQVIVLAGNFEVEQSRDNTYYVESDMPFQCYSENGAFYIAGGIEGAAGDVTLYVPEDILDKVTIRLAAGNFESNTLLECDEIELQVAGGNVEMTDLEAELLEINDAAGNVEIANGTISQGEINCLMGNVSMGGAVCGNLETNCVMGNVYMELQDDTVSYQCEQENMLGNIVLGIDLQENADALLELHTVMGNIEVWSTNNRFSE